MIIGLAGKAGCGKDTVAQLICEMLPGARTIAFADPIRRVAQIMLGFTDQQMNDRSLKEIPDPDWGISPRRALQLVGTEVGRRIHPEIWTTKVRRTMAEQGGHWVITDMRFPNEVRMIREMGGQCWWIDRDTAAVSEHVSETSLHQSDEWDVVLDNTGSVHDLERRLRNQLEIA